MNSVLCKLRFYSFLIFLELRNSLTSLVLTSFKNMYVEMRIGQLKNMARIYSKAIDFVTLYWLFLNSESEQLLRCKPAGLKNRA